MTLELKWYHTGLEKTKTVDLPSAEYRVMAQAFANKVGVVTMWREGNVSGKRWKYIRPQRITSGD